MIRVHAFRVVARQPVATVLEVFTGRASIDEVLDLGLCSWGRPDRPQPRDRFRRAGGIDPQTTKTGPTAWRVGGSLRRFEGLIIAHRATGLADCLLTHDAVQPGTGLGSWCLGHSGEENGIRNTLRSLEDRLEPHVGGIGGSTGRIDGLVGLLSETGLTPFGSDGLLGRISHPGVEIVANEPLIVDGHLVDVRLWATRRKLDDEPWCWFDGESVGVSRSWGELPRRLRLLLERSGWSWPIGYRVQPRPLADLTPQFLLRVPAAEETTAEVAPLPDFADRPLVLLPSTDPVALRRAGQPLDLPVLIGDNAAAVLARCPGEHVFDPRVRPIPVADLPEPTGHRWLVASAPVEWAW